MTETTDAYRVATPPCPRCDDALEQRGDAAGCVRCGGLWLPEARLAEMLAAMHHAAGPPAFTPRLGAATLPCPACEARMLAVSLEGVEVDRCAAGHGVWFDSRELEAALHAAAAAGDATSLEGVPDVRIGLGRGLLRSFGEVLKLIGYGAVGIVAAIVLSPLQGLPPIPDWGRRRRKPPDDEPG